MIKIKLTTEIPSIAKIAVPKNRGSLSLGANQGTELKYEFIDRFFTIVKLSITI